MTSYTVLGIFEDSGQVLCEHITASEPAEAIRKIATICPHDVQFIGAIEGRHRIVTPCEDSGKTAYAADLRVDYTVSDELPQSVIDARAGVIPESDWAVEFCPKCGKKIVMDGHAAVYTDEGTGDESGRAFYYCSERCRETH